MSDKVIRWLLACAHDDSQFFSGLWSFFCVNDAEWDVFVKNCWIVKVNTLQNPFRPTSSSHNLFPTQSKSCLESQHEIIIRWKEEGRCITVLESNKIFFVCDQSILLCIATAHDDSHIFPGLWSFSLNRCRWMKIHNLPFCLRLFICYNTKKYIFGLW